MEDLGIGAACPLDRYGIYTIDDLAEAVDKLLPNQRQCLIQLQNFTGKYELRNQQIYIDSGNNEKPLPSSVGVEMETTLLFTKTPHKASAVLAYDLIDPTLMGATVEQFILIFSVPYDFNVNDNCFSMFLFPYQRDCNEKLYKEMKIMLDDTKSTDRHDQSLSMTKHGFRVEATMTDTNQSNLVVKIHDN